MQKVQGEAFLCRKKQKPYYQGFGSQSLPTPARILNPLVNSQEINTDNLYISHFANDIFIYLPLISHISIHIHVTVLHFHNITPVTIASKNRHYLCL